MIVRTVPRLVLTALALSLVAGLATACGSDTDRDRGAPRAAGFPITLTSAHGDVTIADRPRRVVTLGWGSNDAALALGVVPVGMSKQVPEDSDGITPWARAKLGNTTPTTFSDADGELPFETIAALRPDLILAVQSGVTAQQYKTLSGIAPTVAYPGEPWSTSWTEQLAIVGKALGRSAQATRLQREVSSRVAAAAKAHPEFRGKTATFGSGTKPGGYNIYLPDDPRMTLLGSLGFTVSRAATDTFEHGPDSPAFATSISLEQLPRLRTDVLVAWYLTPATRRSVESNDVFRRLPAVASGAYVPITDPHLLFATSAPDVLTIPWMLGAYVPELARAAARAGTS